MTKSSKFFSQKVKPVICETVGETQTWFTEPGGLISLDRDPFTDLLTAKILGLCHGLGTDWDWNLVCQAVAGRAKGRETMKRQHSSWSHDCFISTISLFVDELICLPRCYLFSSINPDHFYLTHDSHPGLPVPRSQCWSPALQSDYEDVCVEETHGVCTVITCSWLTLHTSWRSSRHKQRATRVQWTLCQLLAPLQHSGSATDHFVSARTAFLTSAGKRVILHHYIQVHLIKSTQQQISFSDN